MLSPAQFHSQTVFKYWPYDEVTLTANADGSLVTVGAPWLHATLQNLEDSAPELKLLVQKFHDQTLCGDDIELVNSVFSKLSEYPFCYILPTHKVGEALGTPLDEHTLVDETYSACSVHDFFQKTRCEGLLLERQNWEWDAIAALAFATINGKIHPESLLTVARRFHFIDVVENNKASKNFEFINNLSTNEFVLAAGLLVRQNHYVTQHCQSALFPALETARQARWCVERFMNEEKGHDLLLGAALKSFGDHFSSLPVSPQTKALMHLLGFAAHRNFLGFAMAIDCFERSSYEEHDPLAQLLQKRGFTTAARHIAHHKAINDAGGHENVACGFLRYMAPCQPAYALEALRIAEAVTLVINDIAQSALKLYEQLKLETPPHTLWRR